ncbi:MAG: hypothetical protein L0Y50_04800 [Beijerinckiaceae bacterium]|nr:hypothetical protein [Beijerinckiaceae bacterium]MCI0735578.1 hypothetical protein [Beijerinckiaceae bacterium]
MYSRLILAAAMLALVGTAKAEIFSAGPAYPGNPTGGSVTCRIFNAGLSPVSISFRQIWTNTGVAPALSTDTCNVAVPSTGYCAFTTPASGNLAYSCRINSSGTDNNITGVIEVRATSGAQVTLPLHK